NDISSIGNDFVPLLYQAGYLTLKAYDPDSKEYTLGFPNYEVSEGFWESLAKYSSSEPTSQPRPVPSPSPGS
ncbi:MAG: AAA family ATPase, partial [Muribaculaceae bacterium]|nr:AAA family ATPase [Muribaculaceae bacterium]